MTAPAIRSQIAAALMNARMIPWTAFGDDARIVVSPRRARYLLDCGHTRLYQLLVAGELESYLDGRSRKITTASIKRYVERRLIGRSTATPPPDPAGGAE